MYLHFFNFFRDNFKIYILKNILDVIDIIISYAHKNLSFLILFLYELTS